MRKVIGVLVVLVSGCMAAAPAPAEFGAEEAPSGLSIDTRYDGKYSDDPWFEGVPEKFRAAAEKGIRRAATGLGIDLGTVDLTRIRVYMKDARPESPTWVPYTQALMVASGYPDSPAGIQLCIMTEGMRNGFAADLAQGMTHELTHALMRATCPGYPAMPKWLREGMALYIAGQGPDRLALLLSLPPHTATPGKMLDGLEPLPSSPKHNFYDYPEDYLAMCYLEEVGGKGAVQRLQAELQKGTPWVKAVSAVSGQSWLKFQTGARAYAEAALKKATGTESFREFAKLAALRLSKRYPEALVAADALLKARPKSPYVKLTHYHRARALYGVKRIKDAATAFAAAAAIAKPYTPWDDDLRYIWGCCLYRTEQHELAAQRFEALLRDHPNHHDPTATAYMWGISLGKAGQADAARTVLTKTLAAFPKPKNARFATLAREMLAELEAGGE